MDLSEDASNGPLVGGVVGSIIAILLVVIIVLVLWYVIIKKLERRLNSLNISMFSQTCKIYLVRKLCNVFQDVIRWFLSMFCVYTDLILQLVQPVYYKITFSEVTRRTGKFLIVL